MIFLYNLRYEGELVGVDGSQFREETDVGSVQIKFPANFEQMDLELIGATLLDRVVLQQDRLQGSGVSQTGKVKKDLAVKFSFNGTF